MKTKLLFTAFLLGITATCMAGNDFNPYYPDHIYGGAKLDSTVEISRGNKTCMYYDDKGRPIVQKFYYQDATTSQLTLQNIMEVTYAADGIMFSSYTHHMYNASTMQWEDKKVKVEDIVYDAFGNPIQYTMYLWNQESDKWEKGSEDRLEIQYDSHGNIVLKRDTTWTYINGSLSCHASEDRYEYVYNEDGKVVTKTSINNWYDEGTGFGNPGRGEYTYNDHGDIQTKTIYILLHDYEFDPETGESIEQEGGKWELSYTMHYIYNAFNNLEKRIEYDATNSVRSQITYYYSFRSTTTEVENAEVAAIPSDNYSVILQWPAVANADTYTLEIRKNGELVCTLIFNAQGQLTGISFAPARNGQAHRTQAATQTVNGWKYKLEGLDPDTEYSYTAIAKKNNVTLSATTVFFTTVALEGIEDILANPNNKDGKYMHNGQLFILRGEKVYTVTGKEVR